MRIVDFFSNGVRLYPKNPAFVDDSGSLTYLEASKGANRIGAAIRGHGYDKGAHLGILAPNSNIAFVTLLGLFHAESVWLPINPRNPVKVSADLLQQFDCELLFYHGDYSAEAEQIVSSARGIREAVCIGGTATIGQTLEQWVAGHPEVCDVGPEQPDDIFGIFPTGGTTGSSKGVMIANRNVECMFAHMWSHFRYDDGTNHLVVAPMTHTAGLLGCLHFARGGCNTILPGADIPRILEMIESRRITHLFLPPTVVYMMLSHANAKKHSYSSLKHFYIGAAPTSLERMKEALATFGPVMTELYGQTEAPITICLKAPWDCLDTKGNLIEERLGSVGRPGVFNRVGILDDSGKELPRGQPGEICVKGTLVTPGYYKNPEATAEARAHGWHHTGDVGVMDDDGFIRIVDRKKDMIITGGFNVYPNQVEQVISAHPGVHECAVIGVPDDKWGEAVTAFVIVRPGATLDEETVIQAVKEALGSVQAPKKIHFVEDLPRSPVGKVLKTELRKKFWQGRDRAVA